MTGRVIDRKRTNQPSGWKPKEHSGKKPETHYCVRHNYIYYPENWTDITTGTSYQKGYYDENGTYYRDIAFRRNGRYDNVVCTCEYCGTTSKINWTGETESLTCPACGGPLNITACVDEYTQDPAYTNAPVQTDTASVRQKSGKRVGCGIVLLIGIIVFFVAVLIAGIQNRGETVLQGTENDPTIQVTEIDNAAALFGETLWLDRNEDGSYGVSPDGQESYDKKLTWDYGADSYYDRETECWLWYNTDVVPNLWQYWFEGISSDYESGWMEYEPTGWYIETDPGEWIPLPEQYGTEKLWHMEIDPEDFKG